MKVICLLTLLLASWVALAGLNDSDLRETWHWIRESPDEWKLKDEMLILRTQPDRIWAGHGSKNLLIANESMGLSAEASADVELLDPIIKWEQCGLLVYVDDDTFVKLIVEHIEGPCFIVMAREIGKRRQVLAKIEITGKRAEIRFTVEGDEVHGYWRLPGEADWNLAATTPFKYQADQRFGLFSQDGPRDEKRYARIRHLSWRSLSR